MLKKTNRRNMSCGLLAMLTILLVRFPAQAADSTKEKEYDDNWQVHLYQTVMKYEKPRCFRFFWSPAGCPEPSEAIAFKKKCFNDPKSSDDFFTLRFIPDIEPKIDWYQKNVKYLYYKEQTLPSDENGVVDITKTFAEFPMLKGDYKLDPKETPFKKLDPLEYKGKDPTYLIEFDGKKASFVKKMDGEDEIFVPAKPLESLVFYKAFCPLDPVLSKFVKDKNRLRGADFVYLMATVVATPEQ